MARGKKKTVIDTAHPHTIKKFELIEEYIKSWSQKLMLYENCNTLVLLIVCVTVVFISMMTGT